MLSKQVDFTLPQSQCLKHLFSGTAKKLMSTDEDNFSRPETAVLVPCTHSQDRKTRYVVRVSVGAFRA